MTNYALGASHAVLACCALFLLLPSPDRPLTPSLKPYAVIYKPDCYVDTPDGGEFSVMPLTLDHLIAITYESPQP